MKPAARRQRETLTAPQVFSLVKNPDETIKFLNKLRRRLPTRNLRIKIDLQSIEKIDSEAVAAFVAIMESTEGTVFGNVPADPVCKRRLHDFGFFEHVEGGLPHGAPAGTIRMEHTGLKVESDTARDIIKFGMQRLGGASLKHGPTYNILIEAMTNTFQHAAARRKKGQQRWWAAVYYDDTRQAACFTSVDVGIGILKNFEFRQRLKLWSEQAGLLFKQTSLNQGEKLRMLLQGKVPSRTGAKYRGRGIPNMKEACNEGRINNLLILSNKAFANAGQDVYRELTDAFRGTIIYWEVPLATSEEDNG